MSGPRRSCTAPTKAGGPCPAQAIADLDVCIAHAPLEVREKYNFGTPAAGRKGGAMGRKPRPTEVAQKLVEDHVYGILRPHFLALGMEIQEDGTIARVKGATLTGESKDGEITTSDVEDLGAQIAAAEKLLDRIYGRPKQVSEVSGPEGGPVQLSAPLDDRARSAQAAGLLRDLGEVEP